MSHIKFQHRELADGRWNSLSTTTQLANVGSEVFRTISWRHNTNYGNPNTAFFRALELLSLTKSDPKNHGSKLKEICRVYECLVDWHYGSKLYHTTDEDWQKYFMAFTYAARIGN